jgi:hypothetical protein
MELFQRVSKTKLEQHLSPRSLVPRPYSAMVTWISVAEVLPSYYALGAECATKNAGF